jgi:two-component system sensor histidine kinase DesK
VQADERRPTGLTQVPAFDDDLQQGRVARLVWSGVWMWPLLVPAQTLVAGTVSPIAPAAVGLVVYVALYLYCVNAGFGNMLRPPATRQILALIVFAALGMGLAAAYAGQSAGWLILSLFVGAAGASLLRPPWVFGWVGASTIAEVLLAMPHHVSAGDIWSNAFSTFMGCVLVLVVKQLIAYIHELRDAQARLAHAAVAEERLRFARDLHELLGHTLTLMVVKAQVVRRLAEQEPAAAAAAAVDIEQIGRQALSEVREAVTGYRQRPFATELDGARSAMTDAGIEVSVDTVGTPLPPVADAVFGWAVREGATNVIRHSGARHCAIVVRREGDRATLEIRDDGRGGKPSGTGNGLRGLRERLAAAGGTLSAAPAPGGGFNLIATVPGAVS